MKHTRSHLSSLGLAALGLLLLSATGCANRWQPAPALSVPIEDSREAPNERTLKAAAILERAYAAGYVADFIDFHRGELRFVAKLDADDQFAFAIPTAPAAPGTVVPAFIVADDVSWFHVQVDDRGFAFVTASGDRVKERRGEPTIHRKLRAEMLAFADIIGAQPRRL